MWVFAWYVVIIITNYSLLIDDLSGGYCSGVPPLPIPNREVKPACADGTAMQCGRVGGRLLFKVKPWVRNDSGLLRFRILEMQINWNIFVFSSLNAIKNKDGIITVLWASCRIRTNDPEITNHVLWPTELKRRVDELTVSRRYNQVPLLRSHPGGFRGSWPYRTYPCKRSICLKSGCKGNTFNW